MHGFASLKKEKVLLFIPIYFELVIFVLIFDFFVMQ